MIRKVLNRIPLLFLIATCLYTLAVAIGGNVVLDLKHYLGIGFVVAATILDVIGHAKRNKLLFAVIVLGLINFVTFTPAITTMGITISHSFSGWNGSFGIQPFSLVVLALFVIINWKKVSIMYNRLTYAPTFGKPYDPDGDLKK